MITRENTFVAIRNEAYVAIFDNVFSQVFQEPIPTFGGFLINNCKSKLEQVHETMKTLKMYQLVNEMGQTLNREGGGARNVPDPPGSNWDGCVKPKLKDGISKFRLSNGSTGGCPPPDPSPLSTCPDPSPLSISMCPGSACLGVPRKGGTGGRPPPAPRPDCLRVSLLTPRAPQSGTCSRRQRCNGCTGNVCWISCCDGVQPKVSPIDTMHIRMIVCTFFAKTAICDGDEGGSCITTKAMSSISCNMEV
ncbi:hypothetical protein M9H77_11268 [Catharanthus roseus]|uniref:Uncharacterized protein n=1 Tax=Catharanthus roseus TaxID=4058 RepID=A0ACC0BE26_CATRO|nr:hypothetical protein M9H77_11268 [Catharanthus roseus]